MSTVLRPLASPPRRYPLGQLQRILWIVFLLWSVLVALVWASGWGEAEIYAWTERLLQLPTRETSSQPQGLQSVLLHLASWLDPVWIGLAAVNVYLFTEAQEGLKVARRWALIILLVAGAVAALSAWYRWPLGEIHYTDLLGRRLGPVPLGVPLLWLAVLLGARDLVLRWRPHIAQGALALATGGLVLLLDLALEPVAWKSRVFWLWYPLRLPAPTWPPLQNYLTWFALAALLTYLLREHEVVRRPQAHRRSPAAVFVVLGVVILLTHLGRLLRG